MLSPQCSLAKFSPIRATWSFFGGIKIQQWRIGSARTESEEKVILVSENDLFLTLGKSKTTFEFKHTLNKLEIWPQKPPLNIAKSFSHEESEEKNDFLKNPSSADFDLLDS